MLGNEDLWNLTTDAELNGLNGNKITSSDYKSDKQSDLLRQCTTSAFITADSTVESEAEPIVTAGRQSRPLVAFSLMEVVF